MMLMLPYFYFFDDVAAAYTPAPCHAMPRLRAMIIARRYYAASADDVTITLLLCFRAAAPRHLRYCAAAACCAPPCRRCCLMLIRLPREMLRRCRSGHTPFLFRATCFARYLI